MRPLLSHPMTTTTDIHKGTALIAIARAAIAESLGIPMEAEDQAAWLHKPAASFVTLKLNGNLRGCIGTLQAHRSLIEDVRENARAAAFRDPRFAPVNAQEFAQIEIEMSLLSEPAPMKFTNENDALAQLRPGIDGLVFQYRHYRSTFLPQVWEQLPNPAVFMAHLKQKAGLTPGFWAPEVELHRYTVRKWRERDNQAKKLAVR